MKRGYSASTLILVALLLGVLVWIGSKVNPPVKGGHDDHDEAQSAPPASANSQKAPAPQPNDPKTAVKQPPTKEQMAGRMKEQMAQDVKMHKMAAARTAKTQKPDEMNAEFWQNHDMGTVQPQPTAK